MDSERLMNIDQARQLLARVGVEVPRDMPPQAVFRSLNVLLDGVPPQAVAAAVTTGAEVRYGAQAGVTVPPFLPANYSYNIGVEGRVGLSDVQTGPGLEQSQTFRASLQLQQDDRFAVEKTLVQRLYGLDKYAEYLPQGARDLLQSPAFQNARDRIESNPALRTLARGMPFSFEHVQSEGSRLSYEATVPPELGRRIAAGDTAALPNPMDPLSMPAGSGVLIRGQDFQGSSTSAGFKGLLIGGSDTRLEGSGFSVRRLEGSMVEIATGPIDTVENSFYLGLGRPGRASVRLEAENSMEHRRLSVAQLDLATPEGQTAYRQFLESGRVPDAIGPGIPQAGHSTVLNIEQAQRAGLYVGSGSISFDNSTQQRVTLNESGGSAEYRFEYSRSGQIATESRFPAGADGRPDFSQGQYRLTLPSLGESEAGMLRTAFGGTPGTRGLDDRQAVDIAMDSAQLMHLRERAREWIGMRPGGAERLAQLDREPSSGTSLMERMAGARNAHEVFGAMQNQPQHIVSELQRLSVGLPRERGPLQGGLSIEPAESLRPQLGAMTPEDRERTMDRFYRAGQPPVPGAPRAPTQGEPEPAERQTAAREPAAPASGPLLTSPQHPDHALFTALRGRMSSDIPDEQVAVATARARQEGITPERLQQVAADPNNPNRVWLIGSVPGFRTMIDLSQPAPPLERTSADLLAARTQGAPTQDTPVRERAMSMH
jgi:hypothetical protein